MYDRIALAALSGWFFPLSRLWAAASAAEGSVDRYLAEVPVSRPPRFKRALEWRLRTLERIRAQDLESGRAWDNAFFGTGTLDAAALADVERTRLFHRHRYYAERWKFAPFRSQGMDAPFRWKIPTPSEVAALYGDVVVDPARAFALPDPMPNVSASRPFAAAAGRKDYWLRFPSPSSRMGDDVTARVYEPEGVANPPTLIFGHGIFVEFDHWRGMGDDVDTLVAMGIRVVRPEAPWHGRRVPAGRYGGEPFIATAPCGALDLFTAAACEWAVLIDWCRRTSTAPVCIGGQSLGAMTAQIIADKARHWPARLQPDAMMLITHCGRIEEVAVHGSMAQAWGIADSTMAHGWNIDLIQRFLTILDSEEAPVIPRENVVIVLGTHDDVTPFEGALELVEQWRLPQENRFIWSCGHFSVPLTMLRNHAPLVRFRAVVDRLM